MVTVQASLARPQHPIVLFLNDDYEVMLPQKDDPMVFSVVATKYKKLRLRNQAWKNVRAR
ncbi:hypothetical protein CR513_47907, partial [Mucuna pruriens]